MRGHTPHRMALAHIYHHDQPQRLSGMKGKPVFPITSSRSTSVQYCVHAVGRQAGRWAQKDTHTYTHTPRRTHGASCILQHLHQAPDERNQPWAGPLPLPLLHAQWLLEMVSCPPPPPRGP